jgi:hypothetical protein
VCRDQAESGKPQTGFAGIGAYTAIFTVVYAPIACADLTNLLLAHANKTFSFVTLALEIGVRRRSSDFGGCRSVDEGPETSTLLPAPTVSSVRIAALTFTAIVVATTCERIANTLGQSCTRKAGAASTF